MDFDDLFASSAPEDGQEDMQFPQRSPITSTFVEQFESLAQESPDLDFYNLLTLDLLANESPQGDQEIAQVATLDAPQEIEYQQAQQSLPRTSSPEPVAQAMNEQQQLEIIHSVLAYDARLPSQVSIRSSRKKFSLFTPGRPLVNTTVYDLLVQLRFHQGAEQECAIFCDFLRRAFEQDQLHVILWEQSLNMLLPFQAAIVCHSQRAHNAIFTIREIEVRQCTHDPLSVEILLNRARVLKNSYTSNKARFWITVNLVTRSVGATGGVDIGQFMLCGTPDFKTTSRTNTRNAVTRTNPPSALRSSNYRRFHPF